MYNGTTHNETFKRLQEDYVTTRDNKTLGKMYQVAVEVSANYIRKYQNSRGLRLDVDTLSHDAAIYIVEQYLRKPEFRVDRLSAYAHFGCLKVLFADSKRERREVSYEQTLDDRKKSVRLTNTEERR
jgi:hypothetical protein